MQTLLSQLSSLFKLLLSLSLSLLLLLLFLLFLLLLGKLGICSESRRFSKNFRPLMKNLLLGYFHTPENKRPEVVRVLGNLIGFSQDEISQVGSGAPPVARTWVSTLNPFGGAPKSNLAAVKRQDSSVASSLSKVGLSASRLILT